MGAKASAFIWSYADIQYGFLDRELGFDNLHALAAEGRHRAVRKLLEMGMDPNARRLEGALGADDDERGDSPMICAVRLAPAVITGTVEAQEWLRLTSGLCCRGVLGNKDQPRHVKTLEVLLHFGAKVNQTNLVRAVLRLLLLLLLFKLSTTHLIRCACLQLNQTSLYVACECNVLRVATWLLEHGADVNINCKVGV